MKQQQISPEIGGITSDMLDSMNVEQAKAENRKALDELGGVDVLLEKMGVNPETGLNAAQVLVMRDLFGSNSFPESPMKGFLILFITALSDPTLIVLLLAATFSLVLGILEHPDNGWIEGAAIYIAVFLVATISAGNDYSKEVQFRALEASSAQDERCSVLRSGTIERLNPKELVAGDIIVMQAGDQIPADSIILDRHVVLSNEASLTGEPDDLKKTRDKDCFMLSACLVTEGEECKCLVIGIGVKSQWGKIKANLASEPVNTPLQDKLEIMTQQIGYLGMTFAFGTFVALIVSIWARHHGEDILAGFVEAFILAVTVIVVAIPEGLPLAVTIALAYSTKKMYADQCFIRVLAACETMGNATNICSDKTGTLTENRMTVVEGWFGNLRLDQDQFKPAAITEGMRPFIAEQSCVNRTAYLVYKDAEGKVLDRPQIIGNKTEGALIEMARSWGFQYEEMHKKMFNEAVDRTFSFNSAKKRSTTVLHRPDGSVRIYCKGATEWVLLDCTHYLDTDGSKKPLTSEKRKELEGYILDMANNALRTLLLAHKDLPSAKDLPSNWMESPPDNTDLIVDCIVGIIDPLRGDVTEAVRIAQEAGVLVRMVTGDNIATASAIARRCGILREGGIAVEGPTFRKMTPRALDEILSRVQVMARSSPDDKYLMVTRLNGHAVPDGREAWEAKHKDKPGVTWEQDRDRLLPGYREEWEASRPEGGEVVGVTGDGTNDAPALKAADVGLAMGITGTKVAQGASDIVILDDRFSSIVRAIMWGRSVYDNIRKFLQFQLTVNFVALFIVFIGALAGFVPPLTAVQMLWVNLIMDTFGALALGTEAPTPSMLKRKPYTRNAGLISWPMKRNIVGIGIYQLVLLLVLLFKGPGWFGVRPNTGDACALFTAKGGDKTWNGFTKKTSNNVTAAPEITCNSFREKCSKKDWDCFSTAHTYSYVASNHTSQTFAVAFSDLHGYEKSCTECKKYDYHHGSIMFNTFIFAQIFNEYGSRTFESWNCFAGIMESKMFFAVSVFSVGMQVFLIEIAGPFMKTQHLTLNEWLITIALGFGCIPVGMLLKLIPLTEDPNTFYDSSNPKLVLSTEGAPNLFTKEEAA